MPRCRKCGNSRPFLKLHNGLCRKCSESILSVLNLAQQIADSVTKELSEDGLGEKILHDIKVFGYDVRLPDEYNEIASLMAFRTLTSGERPVKVHAVGKIHEVATIEEISFLEQVIRKSVT